MENYNNKDLTDFELQKIIEFREKLHGLCVISSTEALVDCVLSEQIIRYLRFKKFDVEIAVSNLLRFFRLSLGDQMAKISYEEYRLVYDAQIFVILKQRALDGSKIIWIRPRNWNIEEIDVVTYFAAVFHYLDEALYTRETQKHGFSVIFDFSKVGMFRTAKILTIFSINVVTQFASFIQGAYPLKLKAVHCINVPLLIISFYMGIKYLLSTKIKQRVHLHRKGAEVLPKYFDKKLLPVDLNGCIPDDEAPDLKLLKTVQKKGIIEGPNSLNLRNYFTIKN